MERGIPKKFILGTDPSQLAARDKRNRAIIFNTDVDKVWDQLKPLIGEEMGAEMRAVLLNQGIEAV